MSDVTYKEAWKELKKKINTFAKSMDNVENIGVTMTCAKPKTFIYQFLNTMLRLEPQDAHAEEETTTADSAKKERGIDYEMAWAKLKQILHGMPSPKAGSNRYDIGFTEGVNWVGVIIEEIESGTEDA